MRVQIEIPDGPLAGSRYDLAEGDSLSVGRTAKSKIMLAHDNYLSGLHFQIDVEPRRCVLRDANSSNGTFVNEQRVTGDVELNDGDRIVAGQTRFAVHMEQAASNRGRATLLMPQFDAAMFTGREFALDPVQRSVVDYLRKASTVPLYALVDVAADAALSVMVGRSAEQHGTLAAAGEGTFSAPCLAGLPLESPLLPELVCATWGRGRAVFLTSNHPFEAIRRHLRSFFLARTEDGRPFRFRLQDPQVLQLFLGGCSTDEITSVFGPVQSFQIEEFRDGTKLLEFTISPVGLRQRTVLLSEEPRIAANA